MPSKRADPFSDRLLLENSHRPAYFKITAEIAALPPSGRRIVQKSPTFTAAVVPEPVLKANMFAIRLGDDGRKLPWLSDRRRAKQTVSSVAVALDQS
jgi:hypothetical protein